MTYWSLLVATIGDKMSWDTSPKAGLFYVLLTSKGGNIAFLPHPLRAMLCPCSSCLYKTTNTPTLNGGDRGGVRILLFSEITLFKNNVSTVLSPIVDRNNLVTSLLKWRFFTFKPCIRFNESWINYVRYVMLVIHPLLRALLKCIFVTCDRPIFLVKWKIGIFSFWIDIHSGREAWFCKIIFLKTRSKYRIISRVPWFSLCPLFSWNENLISC